MLLQARNGAPPAGIPAHHSTSHHANLEEIQRKLKPGWTVHLAQDDRLFYCNHLTQTSSWIPPAECWTSTGGGFPYGWEQAADNDGKPYFINHLNKTTTFEDPRKDWTEEPAVPRTVELQRDTELGFGFVAGSEKPVIVRFVTEGSPSVGKLQPGDQILTINGEDVKKAPRDHVIKLVRACKETVTLEVCQPPLDNSGRKSTLLSAAKKAKLKSNPSRVRFAEGVVVNGSPLFPPSNFSLGDSSVPFLPNVLKVFLENGQTKSFKYDSNTTVRDVVESLQQKLCIKAMEHFSLVVEHVKSLRRNKLTLLDPNEPLARIAARPGSHNLRCLFRAAFVPRAASDLATRDLVALEYLYMQCCNDVVQERYAPELKYDIALRLAALHIHQHAIANNLSGKVTVKTVEREFGLERFVPVSLMTTMKRKELRKLISHFLKLNHNLSPTGQKSLTSLQAKLYYLNIISELPSYGAKCFSTNVRDSNMERVILVSPKFGISQILGIRNSVPVPLADIEQMSLVTMTREDELSRRVCIHLPSTKEKQLSLSLEDRDAEELILVLQGYYRLLTGEPLRVDQDRDPSWNDDAAPNYHSPHQVIPTRWSYAMQDDNQHYANFSVAPPYQMLPPANGHVSSVKGTPTMQRAAPCLDNNMNNTKSMKDDKTNGTFDLQSVVSMELLESDRPYVEARNQEVLRRVQEMQELVHNSEQYILSERQRDRDQDRDREESDSESSHISSQDSDTPAPGELKHSDSLLLLTQGQKLLTEAVNEAVRNIDMGCDTEPSESDTDSMSTPTNSPSHKQNTGYSNGTNGLKSSDSSFGLHSPDTLLPNGYRPSDVNIQDLLKRLQEDNCLPYNFAEGTLYLDPDIIDLTMIPPPITPDELNSDGPYPLPGHLSMPPTPFADGVSFDADQMNRRNVYGYNRWSQLSVQQDPNLDLNLDLEAFLATVAVQPPSLEAAPTVELTPEEILSYIIPPPPVTAPPICTQPPHPAPSFVIEYPTVERKGGPFSCCGQTAPAPVRPSNTPAPNLPPRQTIWTQPLKKPPLPPVPSQEVLKKSCLRNGTYDSNQPPIRNGTYDNVPTALRNGAYDNIQPPPLRNGSYDNVQPAARNGHIINREDLSTLQDSREAIFNKSDKLIATYLDRLDFVVAQCLRAQAAGGGQNMDEASFQVAKEQLTNVARYLVTASKMLVKSANDGANLAQNVSNCLRQISQLTELASDVAVHTTAPVQTRNLVLKVRDVVSVFRATLGASLVAPNEMLLQRAENLAGALAALLRSLRVFSP